MATIEGLSKSRLTRLSDAMRGYVDHGEVAGVVTRVHRHGREVHSDAFGWQDEEVATPIRRDTIFRIASMTKPIVSVAALMLLEEGKLRLDDPVDRWLPELAERRVLRSPTGALDDTYPAPRPITVLDLITHRPGLASQFADTGPIAAEAARLHIGNGLLLAGADPDEWLARLGSLPLVYEPGEPFQLRLRHRRAGVAGRPHRLTWGWRLPVGAAVRPAGHDRYRFPWCRRTSAIAVGRPYARSGDGQAVLATIPSSSPWAT